MNRTYVIAEAGVNHNGDPKLASQLVDVAVEAGADAIKFQTFKAGKLATASAIKAGYQQQTTKVDESQLAMLKRLELGQDAHHDLYAYCNEKGIEFLSSAFDPDSLEFLVSDLGLNTLKIPSGEITNGPSLLAHARTGCDLIISSGMATLEEVEQALGVIAFGMVHDSNAAIPPSSVSFMEAYRSLQGQQLLREKVRVLHCTTEYPAPLEDINLKAMQTMRTAFGLDIGYSDHSEGITVPIAAVALGACMIEKHLTLDKTLPGPDHRASLEPDELKAMVEGVRAVELALGNGEKVPMSSELGNRDVARKSLVAAAEIREGEIFTEDNLTIKRPGTGRSPMEFWDMLGEKSKADYRVDEVVG
ncbi:MAG: N-acetylneuraminate synthase [Gammaproteobacteria bacterium]|nr:N-acetylneuraminate synthase [Gammaproteobacteria bacterium]